MYERFAKLCFVYLASELIASLLAVTNWVKKSIFGKNNEGIIKSMFTSSDYKSMSYLNKMSAIFGVKSVFCRVLTLVLFFLSFSVVAQDVTLTLVARDSRTGMQINPDFTAKVLKSDRKLNITTINNYKVVRAQRGEEVLISAIIDGYYPDEKRIEVDENFDDEGRNIVFELDPQPAASLMFDVKDAINNKKIDSRVTFKIDGRTVKEVNSTAGSNLSNIILTLPGAYEIVVASDGYEDQTIQQNVEVNDPPIKIVKEVKLFRESKNAILTIADKETGRLISDTKVRVTNERGEVLKNDKTTGKSGEINLKESKSITVAVEADGYMKFEKKFDLTTKSITVELERNPVINISVTDAESGELMAVNVIITTPDNQTITLKSTSDKPFEFNPEQKGIYEFKISKGGFNSDATTVNISQLANYRYDLQFKIKSIYENYTLVLQDENKATLKNATLKLLLEDGTPVSLKQDKNSGEWQTKLVKGNKYAYTATMEGFRPSSGVLNITEQTLIAIILESNSIPVQVSTFDKFTKKPVASNILFGNNALISSNKPAEKHEVMLEAGQRISPIFTAVGYKKYQADVITNQTDAEIFLVAERYPITFKFTDAQGKVLVPDFLSITNKATSEPVKLSATNVALLDAEASYNVIVRKNEFTEHSSTFFPEVALTSNSGVKQIELAVREFVDQRFRIVNEETGELVSNPKISVQAVHGKSYEVTQKDNLWLASVKNGEEFSVSVEAPGYELTSLKFTDNPTEVQVIKLPKIKTESQVFEAFDEILQRTVAAKFTLFEEESSRDLPTFDKGVHAKADLLKDATYTIRISAPDYRDKEEKFFTGEVIASPLRISFKRNFYPVVIRLITKSDKLLQSPDLTLTTNNKQVKTLYLFDKKVYNTELEANIEYSLKLNVAGFKPVEEKVYLSDIVQTQLVKTIELVEEVVPEPVQEVKLPEVVVAVPTIKQPEEIIEEKVKEVEVSVLIDVFTKNKENLKELPQNTEELAKTLSSAEALGNRYIFTKVYFERSTPTMKPESDEQLNSILSVLASNPKLKIELVGHTDNVGDKRQNQYLSKFRAKVVSSYLFNKGIDDSRILVKGLADEFPVEPNDTEENKAKNRRVELIVIEN